MTPDTKIQAPGSRQRVLHFTPPAPEVVRFVGVLERATSSATEVSFIVPYQSFENLEAKQSMLAYYNTLYISAH